MKRNFIIIGSVLLIAALGYWAYRVLNVHQLKEINASPTVYKLGEDGKIGNDSIGKDEDGFKLKGVFDIQEPTITPSPLEAKSINLAPDESVISNKVSPIAPTVAMLVQKDKQFKLKLWEIGKSEFSNEFKLPESFVPKEICWHPNGNAVFIVAQKDSLYHIVKISSNGSSWEWKLLFQSEAEIKSLVIGPRPFETGYLKDGNESFNLCSYRLFFGLATPKGNFRIASITENGKRLYQVVGPKKSMSNFKNVDEQPSNIESDFALPVAFHPAGDELIWENQSHQKKIAYYGSKSWMGSSSFIIPLKDGEIYPCPNGLALIHWIPKKAGVGVYLIPNSKETQQAQNVSFTQKPSICVDGRGVVGACIQNGNTSINYVPISMPLADVQNAWMFAQTKEQQKMLNENGGLFRPKGYSQLYELYDSENYLCNGYSPTTATRPYLITTDIFWELFGAAYEGIFIAKEREDAIPNFWKFVSEANSYFKNNKARSPWVKAFSTLMNLQSGSTNDPEVKRILQEQQAQSSVADTSFDFSELKPRGHYTSSNEMQTYFRAFKYFTSIFNLKPQMGKKAVLPELNNLPASISGLALKWIQSYSGFISSSRSPLVWNGLKNTVPKYCQYPQKNLKIFPLSWGFDNEILNSTVYHEDYPKDLTVSGPGGLRLLPSGLDLATVLGNKFAEHLLEPEYQKYPPLRKVIDHLRSNFKQNGQVGKSSDNLYDRWISALAVQWCDTVCSANGKPDQAIWQTKRIQTGLATWATLRHATVLVNERSGAECGEGGFEEIVMRAPRGYVEPDPYTFASIADLFECAINYVADGLKQRKVDKYGEGINDESDVYKGIVKRLKQVAEDTRAFQKIAEKQKKGEQITNQEYEKILFVGAVAEHYFLLFKSLANKDYAISTPDPMPKIVDVAGSDGNFLLSAVGMPMEWDYVVPYYGQRQIVKGSIYSYFEFKSNKLMNDKEWNETLEKQAFLPWVKPFISTSELSYPAVTGYLAKSNKPVY